MSTEISTGMSADMSVDTLTVDYRWNIGRVSVVYQSTVGGLLVDCLINNISQKFRLSVSDV